MQVGDRVKIKKSSKYYDSNSSNPPNTIGKIGEILRGRVLNIRVYWDNGKSNVYRKSDLEIYDEEGISGFIEFQCTEISLVKDIYEIK